MIYEYWKTINECLSKKHTKKGFSVQFEDNGNQMSDKKKLLIHLITISQM